jgi:glycosyltransferase involved in cell wall biosynthesis
MEVLFVSHKYPPATGGMEKQSFELIQGMSQFTKVHRLVYQHTGSRLWFFLTLSYRIKKICRRNQGITVIHFNDGLMAAFCLFHRSYRHLIRTVTLHGLDVVFPNKFYQRYLLPRLNQYDSIITVSEATAEACIERGIDAHRITVIHNGVDHSLADFKPLLTKETYFSSRWGIDIQQKKILFMMGRPVKRKGFSWFVEQVFPHIRGEVLLLIAGPTPQNKLVAGLLRMLPLVIRKQIELLLGWPSDMNRLNMLLEDHVFARHVKHLGKIPFEDVQTLSMYSDVFLVPNIEEEGDMEGFGLVCLEAALSGAIVFAAASGGIQQVIRHGVNGILLPPGDAVIWAGALNAYFKKQSDVKQQLASAKSFTICQYGWRRMVYGYYRHFLSLRSVHQKSFQTDESIRIDQIHPAFQ